VTAAQDNYAKAISFANSDHAALTDWQPATKLVTDGDAAFNIMGDWADGYLENPPEDGLGLTPHEGFDWLRHPARTDLRCSCPTASSCRRMPSARMPPLRG
jgi:glucose/mannose transport system substrate-binding protein